MEENSYLKKHQPYHIWIYDDDEWSVLDSKKICLEVTVEDRLSKQRWLWWIFQRFSFFAVVISYFLFLVAMTQWLRTLIFCCQYQNWLIESCPPLLWNSNSQLYFHKDELNTYNMIIYFSNYKMQEEQIL